MEHGQIPPRRDVAEKLAEVLGLDREPLLMWSSTRVSPRAVEEVKRDRDEIESLLRQHRAHLEVVDAPDSESLPDSAPLERLPLRPSRARESAETPATAPPSRERSSTPEARLGSTRMLLTHDSATAGHAAGASEQIPILPVGQDPDTFRREPIGYIDRRLAERYIGGRVELVRPLAYPVSDKDFERLRRPGSEHGPPKHALVSRPWPIVIDPREPYAIRFGRRVILAYCAWDGRELVVLQPPTGEGFARLKARTPEQLEELIVGQVVALSWWS
jgi:hypothetical protein